MRSEALSSASTAFELDVNDGIYIVKKADYFLLEDTSTSEKDNFSNQASPLWYRVNDKDEGTDIKGGRCSQQPKIGAEAWSSPAAPDNNCNIF